MEGGAGHAIADLEAYAVTLARAEAIARILEVERNLARYRVRLDREATADRDALLQRQGDARDVPAAQHVEDAVGGQRLQYALRCIEREGEAFTQAQETGDVVDIAVGERHSRDRARAHAAAGRRRQRQCGIDLLANVRRGVEEQPLLPISAYR